MRNFCLELLYCLGMLVFLDSIKQNMSIRSITHM